MTVEFSVAVLGTQASEASTKLIHHVLVLAGIELIFSIEAGMGFMCFRFVLKTLLITQGWFSYC